LPATQTMFTRGRTKSLREKNCAMGRSFCFTTRGNMDVDNSPCRSWGIWYNTFEEQFTLPFA
ncbi:MAG: hypothetical protein Q8P88_03230, partial [Candidatus Jorgensenbacteria bacterium]|nr:hypothetical protein [Candidatus Jorgensenbacteria bacterium]